MGGCGAGRMQWGLTQQACVAEAAWGGGPVGGVVTDSGSAGLSSMTALEGGLTLRERGGPSVVRTLTSAPTSEPSVCQALHTASPRWGARSHTAAGKMVVR